MKLKTDLYEMKDYVFSFFGHLIKFIINMKTNNVLPVLNAF